MNSDELLKRILEDKPPLPPEDERLHNTINRIFDGQRNKAIARMTLAALIVVFLLTWGLILINRGSDLHMMLIGVVLLMCGLELNVLMKLWYWVVDNKISVIKELKKTQLMIIQLKETLEGEAAPTTPVTSSVAYKERGVSFWETFEPSSMKKISKVVIIASVIVSILVQSAFS